LDILAFKRGILTLCTPCYEATAVLTAKWERPDVREQFSWLPFL